MAAIELGNDPAGAAVSDIDEAAGPGIAVSVAQVESLLGFPFELVALRRGEHWKLRADERAMVAEPLTRKINESALAARAIGAGGDWLVIIGGLVIIVTARLAEDSQRAGTAPTGNIARQHDALYGPAAGGGAPPPDDRAGDLDHRPGPGGRGGGSLNGVSLGTAPAGGAPPTATEAEARPLVQAL
jgi:hypothetical protein